MKYYLITFLLLLALSGTAQQIPFYGFYRDVASFYNPAAAGLNHSFKANLLFRNQWNGLNGSPFSYMGQVETKLENINSGVGLNIMHEEIGFTKYTAITGNYNYQWLLNDKSSQLSVGIAPKFYAMQFPNLLVDSLGFGTTTDWNRSNAFTMNFGAAFQTEKLFIGVSAMNLIPTRQQLSDVFNYNHALHFSVMASYNVQLTENMKLIPNVHVQSDMVRLNVFLGARVEHQKLWYQVGYHNRQNYNASIGYRFLDRINVGYMIGFWPNAPIYPNAWSHEAFIAYELK